MASSQPVIEVENLVVEYGKGAKRHRAVDGVSFRVNEGECVGFIGANGAGKSTTMKSLMGFLFPTSGTIRVFGHPAGTVESRARIGYLPEVALYYPFMKARELLELYGGLSGLSRAQLKERIPGLLQRVGLGGRDNSLLRTFSKGMQQRLGIAQALIAEPDALIFDELSSGLDPLGRYDLRNVLLELKKKGTTIFFSSHELSEVESLCDRIVMIHKGRVLRQATIAELMKPLNQFEIVFAASNGFQLPDVAARHHAQRDGDLWTIVVDDVQEYPRVLSELTSLGIEIRRTASRTLSLEDYFIGLVRNAENKP